MNLSLSIDRDFYHFAEYSDPNNLRNF
ncbi:MAG: hypothetical protein JWP21_2722, partial [Tardiphaga sp.]|nr:hypothetical protein [Tardiphaga sp.]